MKPSQLDVHVGKTNPPQDLTRLTKINSRLIEDQLVTGKKKAFRKKQSYLHGCKVDTDFLSIMFKEITMWKKKELFKIFK